jgi:hypothetical protein
MTVGAGSWWFDLPQLEDLPDVVLVHIFELAFPSIALLTTMLLVQKSWIECLRKCEMPGALDRKAGPWTRERVTDVVLGTTVIRFPSLRTVDLRRCARITDNGLLVVSGLAGLKSLTLSYNHVTDVGLGMVLSSLPVLEELDVTGCHELSIEVLRYFRVPPRLQRLRCGLNDDFDDEMLEILAEVTQLRALTLVNCRSVTNDGVVALCALTRLQELRLSYASRVTETGLLGLSKHTPLEILQVDGSLWSDADIGIQLLQRFPRLRVLNLNRTMNLEFPMEAMRSLCNLNVLQELSLGSCGDVSDNNLSELSLLRDLRKLTLYRCIDVTDRGLHTLSEFPQLQSLNLEGCFDITDTGVQHLSAMTGLRRLCLNYIGNITDVGLYSLSRMSSLRCLSLNGCEQITNKGLHFLYIIDCADELRFRMSNLEDLEVQRCHLLTYDAVSSMRVMRPGCNLQFFSKIQVERLTNPLTTRPNPQWDVRDVAELSNDMHLNLLTHNEYYTRHLNKIGARARARALARALNDNNPNRTPYNSSLPLYPQWWCPWRKRVRLR